MSAVQSTQSFVRGPFAYDVYVQALDEGAVLQVFARPADEQLHALANYRSERLLELIVLRDDQFTQVRELLAWAFPEIERLREQLRVTGEEYLPGDDDAAEDGTGEWEASCRQ